MNPLILLTTIYGLLGNPIGPVKENTKPVDLRQAYSKYMDSISRDPQRHLDVFPLGPSEKGTCVRTCLHPDAPGDIDEFGNIMVKLSMKMADRIDCDLEFHEREPGYVVCLDYCCVD